MVLCLSDLILFFYRLNRNLTTPISADLVGLSPRGCFCKAWDLRNAKKIVECLC